MAEEQEQTELEQETEGAEEQDAAVSEQEATDGAIKDAEPKTYTEEQFGGLLRDKQNAERTRQEAQTETAIQREANEQLRRELKEAQKLKDTELSEEDALEGVTRGELLNFGKTLTESITKAISTQRDTDKATTLNEQRAQDVVNLRKTHTVKAMGEGLDAQTVVDEGAPYLQMHHPELFKAAMAGRNAATELYKLAVTFVPDIAKRAAAKHNAKLATQLDDSGELPPSGASPPQSEENSLLEGLMDGSITEADVDKMVLGSEAET